MSSVWVILLDTSSSMGEGFAQQSAQGLDPLGESGAWEKKIDAAKEILLRQLESLRAQDVAVIQFNDSAWQIFHGTRDELLRDASIITSLSASGGTSIAAAIDAVTNDQAFEAYQSLSVLLLTDGQSDKDEATRAANDLVRKYPFARIDTIIIDETEAGREVAEAVSINGTVRNATSTVQLESAVKGARANALRGELQNLPLARFAAQQELSLLQEAPPPTLIRVTSGEVLNASTLRDSIAPMILAFESFESAASIAEGREITGSVASISQDSPISINLTGLKEAVQLVLEYAIPWRRKQAKRLSELEVRKSELEIEREQNDLSLHEFDREQRRLELTKLQLEVTRLKLDLAEIMLKDLDPDRQLRGEAREQALRRLLLGIEQVSTTPLEFVVVHERLSQ